MGFGCGRLLEAKWKGEGVGAYSPFLPLGWAQIRGWALIRINTVFLHVTIFPQCTIIALTSGI